MKRNIVLQEMGGKYENQYVATMLGNLALCKFYPGDVVAVTMRFSTREYNGQVYQDILLTDLYKFNWFLFTNPSGVSEEISGGK